MYAVIEGGGCSRGLEDHPAGIIRIRRDGSYRYVADISAFIRANPVAAEPLCGLEGDCEPDGVPHSLLAVGHTLYVVETNHNSILRINPRTGSITRVYDLSIQDPAPIILVRRHGQFLLGGFDGLIQTFDHRFGPVRTLDEGFGPIVDLALVRDRVLVLETFATRRAVHAEHRPNHPARPGREPHRDRLRPELPDRHGLRRRPPSLRLNGQLRPGPGRRARPDRANPARPAPLGGDMPKVLIAVVAAIAAMTAATASAAPDDTTLASRASKREPFPPARLWY